MIRKDDRTSEQQTTHQWLIVGTDRAMSAWGKATVGASYAAWACKPMDGYKVLQWVERRSDMTRVREAIDRPGLRYRPGRSCGHLHIYLVDDKHPALA